MSGGTHLNDQELLDRLYGISEPGEHLGSCADCTARWQEMLARKATITTVAEVSADILAAQRRAIYARLGERPRSSYRWIPALAAACLIVAAFFVNRPGNTPPAPVRATAPVHVTAPAHSETSDAQLFAEVYSMQESMEPRAAAPIRALFQDQE